MQNLLVKQLAATAGEARIADVRIGLGYSAVRLDSGQTGLAWTPPQVTAGCSHLKMAASA